MRAIFRLCHAHNDLFLQKGMAALSVWLTQRVMFEITPVLKCCAAAYYGHGKHFLKALFSAELTFKNDCESIYARLLSTWAGGAGVWCSSTSVKGTSSNPLQHNTDWLQCLGSLRCRRHGPESQHQVSALSFKGIVARNSQSPVVPFGEPDSRLRPPHWAFQGGLYHRGMVVYTFTRQTLPSGDGCRKSLCWM